MELSSRLHASAALPPGGTNSQKPFGISLNSVGGGGDEEKNPCHDSAPHSQLFFSLNGCVYGCSS
jgi:hypothetical protein